MTHYEPSVEELRHESERSRAALTDTVVQLREKVSDTADELKARLSPSHLRKEVKGYVRSGGEQMMESIERRVRENPLQAVAIGAGLAYPLLGLLKNIPVPIMLIGAGLWMSTRSSGASHSRSNHKTPAPLGADSSAFGMDRGPAGGASSGAGGVADKLKSAAEDMQASVASVGANVAESLTANAVAAKESISNTASAIATRASELGDQSRNAVADLMDRNPLLVGGVGVAIGAFIAAALPASDAENRVLGEPSDNLKQKVRNATSDGIEGAKNMAANIVNEVAASAEREGLGAEGIGTAVEEMTQGVKSVVDRGVAAALGDAAPNSSKPMQR